MNDMFSRIKEKVSDMIEAINVTLDNIKKYTKDEKLELDFELINMMKDRESRLMSKLDYFKFISGKMTDKQGQDYMDGILATGGVPATKGGLGDIRDFDNVTVVKHNLESAEQWVMDIDKVVVWINRGQSQVPTEEERKQGDDFFKLVQINEVTATVELGETVDISIDMDKMDLNKVAEYFLRKLGDKCLIKENNIYIAKDDFSKVRPFVNVFIGKQFIKYK